MSGKENSQQVLDLLLDKVVSMWVVIEALPGDEETLFETLCYLVECGYEIFEVFDGKKISFDWVSGPQMLTIHQS